MPIPLSTPITQPAITFDTLWFASIIVDANDVASPPRASITVAAVGTDQNGAMVMHPHRESATVEDLFAFAAARAADGKPAWANAVAAVLAAAEELVRERGLLGLDNT